MKFACVVLLAVLAAPAHAAAPIEAYGELPEISQMAISPDGERLAYVLRSGDSEGLVIFEPGKGVVGGVKIEKGTTRRVFFATDDHVILQVSTLSTAYRVKDDFEFSSAVSYNIRTQKMTRLLRRVSSYQSGLGAVIGVNEATKEAYMPAFVDEALVVMKADLDTGDSRVAHEGGFGVIDWVVNAKGAAIAREDFSRYDKLYAVRTKRKGEWEQVYVQQADEPPFSLVGALPDESALVVWDEKKSGGHSALFKLDFDGRINEPLFAAPGKDVDSIYSSVNRAVHGVRYSGLFPTYEFFDNGLTVALNEIQSKFPGSAARLVDWSRDMNKLLLHVSGSHRAPAYYLVERGRDKVDKDRRDIRRRQRR